MISNTFFYLLPDASDTTVEPTDFELPKLVPVSILLKANASDLELRLSDGENKCQGRVEILLDGTWVTVCGTGWDLSDASIVCRQLGCGAAAVSDDFGPGNGSILLEEFQCAGNESWLWECPHHKGDSTSCDHEDDAAVTCSVSAFEYSILRPNASDLELRLSDGENKCQGRVEILLDGTWITVCGTGWDLSDASVVCKQLGCGAAAVSDDSGPGNGSILLEEFQCAGNESWLWECPHHKGDSSSCGHEDDAAVTCSVSDMELRLSDGENKCQGRVEANFDGTWTTVCGTGWDMSDASVVCRQLGCGAAAVSDDFGPGNGSILLEEFQCAGNESWLWECPHHKRDSASCDHEDDAAVNCSVSASDYSILRPNASDLELRLSDGENKCQGRVEILLDGTWVTVCGTGWDLSDASVVCRQLGCGAATVSDDFGPGNGSILLEEFQCAGNESWLWECPHHKGDSASCDHEDDAVINCSASDLELRLSDGKNKCQGRVEILLDGTWVTVCGTGWDLSDASVVCRQLGCGAAAVSDDFGPGNGSILLEEFQCAGNESWLWECPHHKGDFASCDHEDDAAVTCSVSVSVYSLVRPDVFEPQLRLSDGENKCQGRVEVNFDGTWTTVCGTGWDLSDASVVCRQLGCGAAAVSDDFGPGNGSILLEEFQCAGSESWLWECPYDEEDSASCDHEDDAAVTCSGAVTEGLAPGPAEFHPMVRLADGFRKYQGRVEVFYDGVWGTICNHGWDLNDATVVCKQLGYEKALSSTAVFDVGNGRITLDDVHCTGNESSLWECPYNVSFSRICDYGKEAGATCSVSEYSEEPEFELQLRLVNGQSRCQGRVEIFFEGTWGTVCDDFWDPIDAGVVCRQLGCGTAVSSPANAYFGSGEGDILLDDLFCEGSETFLWNCINSGWMKSDCDHSEDAGAVCSGVNFTKKPPEITEPQGPQAFTDSPAFVCGGSLSEPSGTFSSPFYPRNYPNNVQCIWQITVSEHFHVKLTINSLQMENSSNCNYDFVEIYDGLSYKFPLLGRICQNSDYTFISSSNILSVLFSSDAATAGSGFQAIYYSIPSDSSNSVSLVCSADYMHAEITRAYLQSLGYSAEDVFLNDPSCKPQIRETFLVFNIPYNSCGTVRGGDSDTIVYSNTIRAYPSVHPVADQKKLNVDVYCKMIQNTMVEVIYFANETTEIGMAEDSHYQVNISFYRSSTFLDPVTELPYYVSLGQHLYLQATLHSSDQDLVMFLDSCVASPNSSDFMTQTYALIKNGCAMDTTFQLYDSPSTSVVRFEFAALKLFSLYPMVYMQFQLVICRAQDLASRCYQGCVRRHKRATKSTNTYLDVIEVTVGPVMLQRKHIQKRHADSARGFRDEEGESQDLLLPFSLTSLALVLVVLAFAGLLWKEKLKARAAYRGVGVKTGHASGCNLTIAEQATEGDEI
ncbi:deleted in malignant brain tumors 1 protein-like [Rhinatrema bivittatum]|uniref:deleted in malignant brain tumors 1 protein-like n=1 Tax=Rhinatrema bivittatum TaxID=194408 RepID=UPI00112A50EE|nr:deleted in malignant brain tumors 1 protein-like [Rhinatrema bivittatum]